MAGTIETVNNSIISKIDSLYKIINILSKNGALFKRDICAELDLISTEYELGSVKILSDYFLLIHDYKQSLLETIKDIEVGVSKDTLHTKSTRNKSAYIKEKDTYHQVYQNYIHKENIRPKLDKIYFYLKSLTNKIIDPGSKPVKLKKKIVNELKALFNSYENTTILLSSGSSTTRSCINCQNRLVINASISEILCTKCGLSQNIYGALFEDDQAFINDGLQRSKHGSYDPSKHCRFWVERIQARETTEIPELVVNQLKSCILTNKVRNLEMLTCKDIRRYLRITHNSRYNDHIPLIRKIITGVTPPQLSDREIQLIHFYFDKVIKIYDEIKPCEKTNCPYHPYFIYKIIEHICPISSYNETIRRQEILRCIHLQSRETLIENDKIWKQICDIIGEIEYKPTDRNAQYMDD